MTTNIVPFEQATLPAFLASTDATSLNTDLTSHSTPAFPVISIKGKNFTEVRDGERTILMNPLDPESPAHFIDMVLVKANKATSKVFYLGGYDEKAEAKKPDCWSNDGVRPDSTSEVPQAVTCAGCANNQWGSKSGDSGKTKGKACADVVRLAIATPDQLNDPYLLRVPPASIRSLGEYGQMLAKRNVGYNQVITKISFDIEAPTPKLMFKPVGFVSAEQYAEIKEISNSDLVKSIIGSGFIEAEVKAVPKPEAPKKVEAKKVEAKKPNGEAVPQQQPAKKVDIGEMKVELNLDNLSFDD